MGEEKPLETRHIPKIVPGLPQSLTDPTTHNPIILITTILPPPIQMLKFRRTKFHPLFSRIFLPYIQITLNHTRFHPLIRILLPTVPMYSRATDHLRPLINSKLQHIKNPSKITKLQCQITRETSTLEPKVLAQMPAIINRFLPLSKAGMIFLVPGLKKGLRGTLPHWLKAGPSYSKDYLRSDTSTLWGPSP